MGQGWQGPSKHQPGQKGHKIPTSKALHIVWLTVTSELLLWHWRRWWCSPVSLPTFHVSVPGLSARRSSLVAIWEFQNLLSTWQLRLLSSLLCFVFGVVFLKGGWLYSLSKQPVWKEGGKESWATFAQVLGNSSEVLCYISVVPEKTSQWLLKIRRSVARDQLLHMGVPQRLNPE